MSYSLICETIRQQYANKWFSGKELANKLSLNYNTLRKKLWNLVEFGFLEKKQVDGVNYYKLANTPSSNNRVKEELADQLEALREQVKDIARVVTQLKHKIHKIEEVLEITPAEPITLAKTSKEEKPSTAEIIWSIMYELGRRKGKI